MNPIGTISRPSPAPAHEAEPPLLRSASPASAAAARLVPGRVLSALVVASAGEDVTLEIAGTRIEARTAVPLPTARRFAVQVRSGGERPVLEVLDPRVREQVARAEALRAALPRQVPVARALRDLAQALGGQPAAARSGPGTAANAAREVLTWVPDAVRLARPDALARAVRDSGLLLEAKLAQAARGNPGRIGAESDLKALLLRALASLARESTPRPNATGASGTAPQELAQSMPRQPGAAPASTALAAAPTGSRDAAGGAAGPAHAHQRPDAPATAAEPRLERPVEGALYRLQAHQLASSARHDPDGLIWQVEIPVRHGADIETLELAIRREARHGGDAEDAWSVRLRLDLGEHGALHGTVTFAGGEIGATLWADVPATRRLLEGRLAELREDLEAVGLTVSHLVLRRSAPHEEPPPTGAGTLLHTSA